jgi:hypothetical protein
MKERIDISGYSYDEFVSFIFDRGIPDIADKHHPWYFDVRVAFDPNRLCEFYTRLFRSQDFACGEYSKGQLEAGFRAIHGGDCSVEHLIWNRSVPFHSRCELVKSMADLFKRFFATEPLETSVCMWWDSLCYAWECGNRNRQRGGEDMWMQDVIFGVLSDLLQSDSEICQGAAVHGLSHLHHPSTPELMQNYVNQHPSLAARFEIMQHFVI